MRRLQQGVACVGGLSPPADFGEGNAGVQPASAYTRSMMIARPWPTPMHRLTAA
jgi:hypothetical protein